MSTQTIASATPVGPLSDPLAVVQSIVPAYRTMFAPLFRELPDEMKRETLVRFIQLLESLGVLTEDESKALQQAVSGSEQPKGRPLPRPAGSTAPLTMNDVIWAAILHTPPADPTSFSLLGFISDALEVVGAGLIGIALLGPVGGIGVAAVTLAEVIS